MLLELVFQGYTGFQVLQDLRSLCEYPPVMIISKYTDSLFVARALHEGAKDYLFRPWNINMLTYRLQLLIGTSNNKGYF